MRSLAIKREIMEKYARKYVSVSREARMSDELVAATGWSRANAPRHVSVAGARKGPAAGGEACTMAADLRV